VDRRRQRHRRCFRRSRASRCPPVPSRRITLTARLLPFMMDDCHSNRNSSQLPRQSRYTTLSSSNSPNFLTTILSNQPITTSKKLRTLLGNQSARSTTTARTRSTGCSAISKSMPSTAGKLPVFGQSRKGPCKGHTRSSYFFLAPSSLTLPFASNHRPPTSANAPPSSARSRSALRMGS